MRKFPLGLTVLASFGIASLFYIWPSINTRLSYPEEPVYATDVTIEPSPARPQKPRPSRFIRRGESIALDDYFVPPTGSNLRYHSFYTRFKDVVKIDTEERTAKFEQDGVFTICGTLFHTKCEVIIAEELPTVPH